MTAFPELLDGIAMVAFFGLFVISTWFEESTKTSDQGTAVYNHHDLVVVLVVVLSAAVL